MTSSQIGPEDVLRDLEKAADALRVAVAFIKHGYAGWVDVPNQYGWAFYYLKQATNAMFTLQAANPWRIVGETRDSVTSADVRGPEDPADAAAAMETWETFRHGS